MSATADQEMAELRRTYAAVQKERDAALAALTSRNSQYGERIEQQAATVDVLKVMSASPSDPQPVFQLIVERARAFCNADDANLALVDGNMLHLQATTIQEGLVDYTAHFPRPLDTTSMWARCSHVRSSADDRLTGRSSALSSRNGRKLGVSLCRGAAPPCWRADRSHWVDTEHIRRILRDTTGITPNIC
jgi:hypothetical protein